MSFFMSLFYSLFLLSSFFLSPVSFLLCRLLYVILRMFNLMYPCNRGFLSQKIPLLTASRHRMSSYICSLISHFAFRILQYAYKYLILLAPHRLFVLLFSHSLLSSFPRMLSFAKLKCFSKTFQSRHSRLLILFYFDPGPSPVFITLFGQNFRFVLGGRSRCSNVPFPA